MGQLFLRFFGVRVSQPRIVERCHLGQLRSTLGSRRTPTTEDILPKDCLPRPQVSSSAGRHLSEKKMGSYWFSTVVTLIVTTNPMRPSRVR